MGARLTLVMFVSLLLLPVGGVGSVNAAPAAKPPVAKRVKARPPAAKRVKARPPVAKKVKRPAPRAEARPRAVTPRETTPPPVATKPAAPGPAQRVTKRADGYRPLGYYRWRGGKVRFPIMLGARTEAVNSFAVDRDGNTFQSGAAISPLLRIGVRLETTRPLVGKLMLMMEYEHDLPTGSWTSGDPVDGEGLPNGASFNHSLRKAYGRLSVGPYLHVGGGFMTSHWGLGLLANDGGHGWEPGSARFTDPRGGDIVLRGFLATGPLTKAGIVATVAFDKVWEDAILLDGDSAYQFIASALVGRNKPHQGGFFLVHRRQTATGGRTLNVTAIDLAGRTELKLTKGGSKLIIEAEAAVIFGETSFGASPDYPTSKVIQLGAALRTSLDFCRFGGVLDLVYASGDQNSYDDSSSGFRADPNFETGLLLFRYVQAAQTGRGYGTATDPQLVGAPPGGIERLPTRGGVSNAVVIFPRLWVRPVRGLEIYGGVLVALAPVKNIDPFNTKLAGGSSRNALDGTPGSYWGTEVDLGVRYRLGLRRTVLEIGLEGGVLFPGSALRDASGDNPKPAYGGRLLLSYRL